MSLVVDIEKQLKNTVLKVSFDTREAKGITGILGASGCGKTMTLKCIAGIETPDRGIIVLNDRVLYDSEKKINLKVQQRRVGYLFQNYALFSHMTVEENIATALYYSNLNKGIKMSKKAMKEKAEYFMELVHVKGLRKEYPLKLSGGEQQRVALARVLASEPELLMLDEPFSALDFYLKERLQGELLELLSTYKKDVLLVTHSREEIYRFCSSMLIMEKGTQVEYGSTQNIFSKPNTVAAAKLTGCENIVKIRQIDDHTLELLKWNIKLRVRNKIPKGTTHIGLPAHLLEKAEEEKRDNLLHCEEGKILEDLVDLIVIFKEDIWWRVSKEAWKKEYKEVLPRFLHIKEESIIYLCE